ncbi:MAG TPA: high-affinity nickel-transport family protein [Polyangiaceae bacterium]|jgi:nickel/cobalt exporter|nr:high-affinity nickel-transport family protein [Polyangiaceae bacterium]
MNGLSVLLLGVGLGLRHATDADHVVVVSTLLQREPGVGRAARVAALWGAGHTMTFLGVGLLVVLAELRMPRSLEGAAELAVAAMLVGLGLVHLLRKPRQGGSAYARPLAIGLVHGLAGSASIALLAATTIHSRAMATVYLGLFGAGTVAGMVLLTVVLSCPISWAVRAGGAMRRTVTGAAALLSIGLGLLIAVQTIGAHT